MTFELLFVAALGAVGAEAGSVPAGAAADQGGVVNPWLELDLDPSAQCLPWEEATEVFNRLDLDFAFAGSATITRDSDARVVLRVVNHGKEAIAFTHVGMSGEPDLWLEVECEGPAWGYHGWYPVHSQPTRPGLVIPVVLRWDHLEQIPHTVLNGGESHVEEFPLNSIEASGQSGICRVSLGSRLQFLVENSGLTIERPACVVVEAARTLRIDMQEAAAP